MKNDPKDIEERIIPYIEGVLNSKEHEEVRDAVINGELEHLGVDEDELAVIRW